MPGKHYHLIGLIVGNGCGLPFNSIWHGLSNTPTLRIASSPSCPPATFPFLTVEQMEFNTWHSITMAMLYSQCKVALFNIVSYLLGDSEILPVRYSCRDLEWGDGLHILKIAFCAITKTGYSTSKVALREANISFKQGGSVAPC